MSGFMEQRGSVNMPGFMEFVLPEPLRQDKTSSEISSKIPVAEIFRDRI